MLSKLFFFGARIFIIFRNTVRNVKGHFASSEFTVELSSDFGGYQLRGEFTLRMLRKHRDVTMPTCCPKEVYPVGR